LARDGMLVGQRFGNGLDWPDRDAGLLECSDPLLRGPLQEFLLDQPGKFAVVLHSRRGRGEAWIVDQVVQPERAAGGRPAAVRRADVDPAAVGALEGAV